MFRSARRHVELRDSSLQSVVELIAAQKGRNEVACYSLQAGRMKTKMETVAFYSYKGGVGRTLLVANTAQFLAMSGRKVVAVDLDLEAPGLHQKLGDRDVWKSAEAGTLRGAVDVLLGMFSEEPDSRSLRDAVFQVNLPLDVKEGLMGYAGRHRAFARLLDGAGEAESHSGPQPPHGRLAGSGLALQEQIEEEFQPDYLLIDSRTGITELGGLATSLLADRVVCLTTTAPESVEGTKVVADALRKAPRLSSQKPLRLDFLVTRVVGDLTSSPVVSHLKEQFGSSVSTLPHDSGIANQERVMSGRRASEFETVGKTDYDQDEGQQLFSATLDWIAQSFPGHEHDAKKARSRLERVHHAWQWLTRFHPPRGIGWSARTGAWPLDRLCERVAFKSRVADIIAYDSAAADAKPLMIIEYVENEDRDNVATWWLNETAIPVVVLLSKEYEPSDFYSKSKKDSKLVHRREQPLPLPLDFDALSDPTDVSIDSLLDTVRRGHPEYLERIVNNWTYGDVGRNPKSGSKIVDALSRVVDDIELAREVLEAVSGGFHQHRNRPRPWLQADDDLLLTELYAPLLWRLPPEAGIIQLRGADHKGMRQQGLRVRNGVDRDLPKTCLGSGTILMQHFVLKGSEF